MVETPVEFILPVTSPIVLPVTSPTNPEEAVTMPAKFPFVAFRNVMVETPVANSEPKNPKLPTGAMNPAGAVIIPVVCMVSTNNCPAVDMPVELKLPVNLPVTSPVTFPVTLPSRFPVTSPVKSPVNPDVAVTPAPAKSPLNP